MLLFLSDKINGDATDYIKRSSRSPSASPHRSRSRSPRSPRSPASNNGRSPYLSVRRSPDLRGRSSVSPNREAVQAAAREAAEAAINMADKEERAGQRSPRPRSASPPPAEKRPRTNGISAGTPPPLHPLIPPASTAGGQNSLANAFATIAAATGQQLGMQQLLTQNPLMLAALAATSSQPPVSLAGGANPAAGLSGLLAAAGGAGDQNGQQNLQALTQLQSLFLLNPAAAGLGNPAAAAAGMLPQSLMQSQVKNRHP